MQPHWMAALVGGRRIGVDRRRTRAEPAPDQSTGPAARQAPFTTRNSFRLNVARSSNSVDTAR